MAGETEKSAAICLEIRPWSKTSHIVSWLTPSGRVGTVVKGAVRPKSFFLGQYDFNYTCDIVYYARAKGELHALRECVPVNRRDGLRGGCAALALAGYARGLAGELCPNGDEARGWFALLTETLDAAERGPRGAGMLALMLDFELKALHLAGLDPRVETENGVLKLRGEREIRVSAEVAAVMEGPLLEKNVKILLDLSRIISVYYVLNLDQGSDTRRSVLGMICNEAQRN